jgi:hypothetical protein
LTTGTNEAATAPLQSSGGSVDPAVASDTRPARPIGQKSMKGKRKVGEELAVLTNYLDIVASALKEPIFIASCASTNGNGELRSERQASFGCPSPGVLQNTGNRRDLRAVGRGRKLCVEETAAGSVGCCAYSFFVFSARTYGVNSQRGPH